MINNRLTLKTMLKTLIGTSIVSSLMILPVRAHEDLHEELILSQNYPNLSDRPTYSEPSADLKKIVGLTGLAIGTGVIGYHLTRASKPSLVNSIGAINKINNNSNTSLLDRVSPKLRRELLRLVHNRQTASRLLSGTLISHPDRSPNWLAEKVIYDLKRDR
jgi:hypothetical protein